MNSKKAWESIEEILCDVEGNRWSTLRNDLKIAAQTLSADLSREKFLSYLERIKDYKSKKEFFYQFFGFGILAMIIQQWARENWARDCYGKLLDESSRIEKDNDRAVALVGNHYWPGIVEFFPYDVDGSLVEDLYSRAFEITESVNDHMQATALAGIGQNLYLSQKEAWLRSYFKALIEKSLELNNETAQVEALSGIMASLGKCETKTWIITMMSELINKSDSLSEDPSGMFEDSPRVAFLRGIIQAIPHKNISQSIAEVLALLWDKVDSVSDQSERSKLYGTLATASACADSTSRHLWISRLIDGIILFKNQSARSAAIGRLASGLAEGEEFPETPHIFDQLIDHAIAIQNEEHREKALAYSVYSIGESLARMCEHPWARSKLNKLLDQESSFPTQEVRSKFLGDMIEILHNSENSEWAFSFCNRIIDIAAKIKKDEARSDAYSNVAASLAKLKGVTWLETLFKSLLALAYKEDDEEYLINTVFSRDGIIANGLDLDPQPNWAIEMARQALTDLNQIESRIFKTLAIKSFAEDILSKITNPGLISKIVDSLFELCQKLDEAEYISEAIEGIASGIIKIDDINIKKGILTQLILYPRSVEDDRDQVRLAASVLNGAFGGFRSRFDDQDKPWIKEFFIVALETASTIEDDRGKATLLAGDMLTVDISIVHAIQHLADPTWKEYFHQCNEFIRSFKNEAARFVAFTGFSEMGIGNEKINDSLKDANWLKEFMLETLNGVIDVLPPHDIEDFEKNALSLHKKAARMLDFLERRIEVARPNIVSVFTDRKNLYERLLNQIDTLSEDILSEQTAFTEDNQYSISPKTSLLKSMARDFILDSDYTWGLQFLSKLLDSASRLHSQQNRLSILFALLEGISNLNEPKKEIELMQYCEEHVDIFSNDLNELAFSILRSYIRLNEHDHAISIALRFTDPIHRLQAIRELAITLETELPRELQETLRELVSAEERLAITNNLFKNPDYKDENPTFYDYDVAISFAGPDRFHAERLVSAMKDLGLNVFYDRNNPAELWGENLVNKLYSIYSSKAIYCLILISKNYTERKWTLHELEAAQSRQLESKEAYILPIRLDDTQFPFESLKLRGYLSLKEYTYDAIAKALSKKVLSRRRRNLTGVS